MNILLDVMGGDKGPAETVRGALLALEDSRECHLTLVGDEAAIRAALAENGAGDGIPERMTVIHAEQTLTMEDDPMSVIQSKKHSSMTRTLRMLAAGEGDAAVSTGNTGALFTGASVLVRNGAGIRRAAIATVLPFREPLLLLDSGANVTVTPEDLLQFAQMGSVYASRILGVEHPRIGLANNGAESHKGTPVTVEAHRLLSEQKGLSFVGNIEGKDIPFSRCDVLVTDGFTGNLILKLTEGISVFFLSHLHELFQTHPDAHAQMRDGLQDAKRRYTSSTYGGAPFLGIRKPVIKAHGSSDAEAVRNAIAQAVSCVETGIAEEIVRAVSEGAETAL